MNIDRRRFVGSAAGMAAITGVAADWFWPKHSVSYRRPRSLVAVLNAAQYSEEVEALLMSGLRLFRLNVPGKSVLLKPNLVEDLPGPVNTSASIIGAAARCFLRLGATRVVVGEGPGHQRDTELVVQAANLKPHLADGRIDFVDLNRDELASEAEGWLQRPRRAMVAAHRSRFRFHRLNAQGEDSSLGWRHSEPKEYVRHRAGDEVRLAEESASLARNP
jgi:hypothetical protein